MTGTRTARIMMLQNKLLQECQDENSFVVEADVEAKYLCSDRLSHADSSAKETLAPSITYRLHTGSLFRKSLREE